MVVEGITVKIDRCALLRNLSVLPVIEGETLLLREDIFQLLFCDFKEFLKS